MLFADIILCNHVACSCAIEWSAVLYCILQKYAMFIFMIENEIVFSVCLILFIFFVSVLSLCTRERIVCWVSGTVCCSEIIWSGIDTTEIYEYCVDWKDTDFLIGYLGMMGTVSKGWKQWHSCILLKLPSMNICSFAFYTHCVSFNCPLWIVLFFMLYFLWSLCCSLITVLWHR